jgi:serine protease AprX
MAAITRDLIQQILLEGRAGPRLLTESAIQLDVWYAFGEELGKPVAERKPIDLLLTPRDTMPAAQLARRLHDLLVDAPRRLPPHIAPLEGAVAARLGLRELISVILPLTGFDIRSALNNLDDLVASWNGGAPPREGEIDDGSQRARLQSFAERNREILSSELRTALLVAILLIGEDAESEAYRPGALKRMLSEREAAPVTDAPIWRVSRNRPVHQFGISIETIKADAARRVFEIDCRSVTWAVIDSGIDGSHPAFRDHDAGGFATRIDKALDFSRMRVLAAFDTLLDDTRYAEQLREVEARLMLGKDEAGKWLSRLRDDAREGRPFDWEALSKLLEVPIDRLESKDDGKPNGHGTHVAGVLAGDWREDGQSVYRGVCPNLRLYDLRVLGPTMDDTEFAIIAALEYVRWLNGRNRYMVIHGANLSIGLVHDMENYACGRTPVCTACETTVATGVCVVAAAGNWGAQTYQTADGAYRGYAAISIADPGNAASVITVGSTHRERPHEYGVSFFSSRGPTGDGRSKPDVVAPGEKIDGPLPNLGLGRLDGTSMAAPHVSGIAALLMARQTEMAGNPAAVKDTIIRSATDLGRERHFQGAGLVDALRALQLR